MSKQILDILTHRGILEKSNPEDTESIIVKGFDNKDDFFYKEEYIPLTVKEQNFAENEFVYIPFLNEKLAIKDFVFFDLETTGLSTSGGCLAFLAGIGQINSSGFIFKQFFLPTYSAEPSMLISLFNELNNKIVVSYNGKSYDIPLIKNRMIYQKRFSRQNDLVKMETNNLGNKHLDLLYIARSLFKGILPGCSLQTVEKSLLNLYRTDDIDGFEIPNVFFDFLNTKKDNPLLQSVFFHNKLDITSLFQILIQFVEIFTKKEYTNINKDSISKYLIRKEKINLAIDILKSGVQNNERASMKTLSLVLKKKNNLEDAVRLWYNYIDTATKFEPFAYEELAKYYEHKVKNLELALQIVDDALHHIEVLRSLDKFIDINVYESFTKRKKRLLKKIYKKNNIL